MHFLQLPEITDMTTRRRRREKKGATHRRERVTQRYRKHNAVISPGVFLCCVDSRVHAKGLRISGSGTGVTQKCVTSATRREAHRTRPFVLALFDRRAQREIIRKDEHLARANICARVAIGVAQRRNRRARGCNRANKLGRDDDP